MIYDLTEQPHTWSRATVNDVPAIADMAYQHYAVEIKDYLTPCADTVALNIGMDVVRQAFNPYSVLVLVAKDSSGRIIAYTYCVPEQTIFSPDTVVAVRTAHVDLSLSPRYRIELLKQMLAFIEVFAREGGYPVICSSTIRSDQAAFLRLHERMGYIIRGSSAYRRLV